MPSTSTATTAQDAATTFLPTLVAGGTPAETVALIDATIAKVLQETLSQHGLSAFAMPRDAALAHEAGHVVVGAHEGLTIRCVKVFSRSTPLGPAWAGMCWDTNGVWRCGPETSVEDVLRRGRIIIGGLAGELATGLDIPGSSLDELALSQVVTINAVQKLDAGSGRSDEELTAFAQQLWHEQVLGGAWRIIYANREPFLQLIQLLHQKEKIQGVALRRILKRVERITL